MAVVKHTLTMGRGGVYLLEWEGIASGDTMDEAIVPNFSDKSVQVYGTFGGVALTIEGSNVVDLTVTDKFEILRDVLGGAASFTSADAIQLLENVYRIKPVLAAGAGASGIAVHILAKVSQ